MDNWNGHSITAAGYYAQLPGWYLAEGSIFIGGTSQAGVAIAGITATQDTVPANLYGGRSVPDGTNNPGPAAADLVQLNPFTTDTVNLFAYQSLGASEDLAEPGAYFTAQWVALGTTQTVASQTFPAATAVTWKAATVDNFSGWNSAAEYVFPVSGVYYVYGQVLLESAETNASAGIAVSGGTVSWGDSVRTSSTAESLCPTVRREIRVTAGQYVSLYVSQSSGGTLSLPTSGDVYSTLLVVFRGF